LSSTEINTQKAVAEDQFSHYNLSIQSILTRL